MDAKTYLAVGSMIQTAAHAHGLTGPVQFTVCRPNMLELIEMDDLNPMTIEDHEPLLTIIPPAVPSARFEARCHLCSWTNYKWSDDEARTILRTHIIDAHLTPIESRQMTPFDRRIS